MTAKANYVRIGIFVMVAIFLLIAGLLAFGARSYFAKKIVFETAVEGDVTGLSVGSSVLFRGVPIGKVSNIDFAPNIYPTTTTDVIVVEFEINESIFKKKRTAAETERLRQHEINKGLRAVVKAQTITGSSTLFLEYLDPKHFPPPPIDYTPNNLYIPSAPGQFTRMLESIEQSLQNLEKLNFGSLGMEASNTLAQTTLLIEELNRLDLGHTVGKANTLLDTLNEAAENINTNINSLKLGQLGGNANDLVVQLKASNLKLQTTLDHLNEAPINQSLDNLSSALQTLNGVLLELKRYPSGFIFGQPPARAKSVEPPSK